MHAQNPIEKACEVVGSQAQLARLVGVRPQSVVKWRRSGRAPAERVLDIESATGGVVTRHILRPDLYPDPEAGADLPQRAESA